VVDGGFARWCPAPDGHPAASRPLVREPRDPLEDPSSYSDAETGNRILATNGVDQPPKAGSVAACSRKTHEGCGAATRDLGEQIVRFHPAAEEEHIEAVRLRETREDLGRELLG
jgi:hypothetical protein